jgi:hypothetical protein
MDRATGLWKARGTVGAVRHRELIRLLSLVVVLNMAVGVVAVAVRVDRPDRRTTQFAGSTGIPLDTENGILAGANFNKRRSPGDSTSTQPTGAPATSATTAPVTLPTGSALSPTTGRPAETTTSTAAPATTATTARPPATTGSTRPPKTSTTTAPPPPVAAPPVTTVSGPNGAARNGGKLADPKGDTVIDGTQDPMKEGRADIVRTRAVYEPGKITLGLQVDQPSDPSKDERWAGDATFISWSVDTNGDGTPDFEVQYFIDAGKYGAVVSRGGQAGADVVCQDDTASFGADGYSLTIPSSCLGDPASFSYRVTTYYDTNPKDENADVASDVAPNGGMSFPISRGA